MHSDVEGLGKIDAVLKVMSRVQERELWRKAPATLSFIVGQPETNKAKVSGRRAAAKGR
jgi:hypothetical protein